MRGWVKESRRHSLARQGIRTGRKLRDLTAFQQRKKLIRSGLHDRILKQLSKIEVGDTEEMFFVTLEGEVKTWDLPLRDFGLAQGFINRPDVDDVFKGAFGDAHTHPTRFVQEPSSTDIQSAIKGDDVSYVVTETKIYEIVPREETVKIHIYDKRGRKIDETPAMNKKPFERQSKKLLALVCDKEMRQENDST
jgi:hypothetical protein